MINKNSRYFKQAELLVRVLPWIAKYDCFALKGGTAINFFVQDMPRLSVDIDLTYLPIQERDESLKGIEKTLRQIANDIRSHLPGSIVEEGAIQAPKMINKLQVSMNGIQIKVEPNLVIRGTVFPCRDLDLAPGVQAAFEMSATMKVVSLADLYGGKICAALDRQHPRDLFDISVLLKGGGLTKEIQKGFLVYLISHDRPIHELLQPVLRDMRHEFETDFRGMANDLFTVEDLIEARRQLIELVTQGLSPSDKEFLVSFKSGEPQWSLLGIDGVERLPAVRWKMANLQKTDKDKRALYVKKLRSALNK